MTKQEIKDLVMKPIIEAGFHAYFVGGCVRDELTHTEPHDYDIVTDATPEQLHKMFKSFIGDSSEAYGVTKPIVKKEAIDIATMRKDCTRGRHPTVVFTDKIDDDAQRRDFTINAMYEDIDGNIIDPTGLGKSDIETKTLRFVGDPLERILEDPLRLFRFCRFEAAKGFDGRAGMVLTDVSRIITEIQRSGGAKKFFEEVSKERMLKELQGIFGGKFFMKDNNKAFDHMGTFGIFEATGIEDIFKEMKATKQNPKWHSEGATYLVRFDGTEQLMPGKKVSELIKNNDPNLEVIRVVECGNVYDHTIEVMKAMANLEHDYLDMFGALLHDVGKPVSAKRGEKKHPEDCFCRVKDHPITGVQPTENFCKSMLMSNTDTEVLKDIVLHHMDMHHLHVMKSKYSIMKLTTNPNWERLKKICIADELGCFKTAPDDEEVPLSVALELPLVKECVGANMPEHVLTGNDLIAHGFKPRPTFAKALDVAYKIQIDQDITDPEKLYKQVKSIVKGN